ncbi:MAG: serine/threonine protein kinase, partial [Planctomycetota bacterium]
MNVLEALAGQLAVQRQLVAPAALEQILATSRGGGGTVSQLLLRGGLLGREALGQLLAAAATSQVVCPACGLSALPQQLAAAAPLDCPRCGGRLLVAETEEATSPPSFPAGRPSSSGSGRRDRHPFTPHGASPLDTRRIAAASGSARFDGDPTGTMRFRRALKEGGTVVPFELLEELGRGGMGVVYKARHTTRDELVALKVLRSGALASKKQRKRFEREVQAMARLDHPNVVPVRDVGRLGDNEYFTMALVDGRSLGDVLKTERLPARRAAEVALDVARGLEHAHQEGIVHRDIKPDNILVDRGGRALITDFGLVHDTDAEERLTRSGALVGTPYYMSPEQARGRRDLLGPQSDVYALGVVLFQMLSGQLPFRAETQLELVEKIVKTPAPAVSSLEPSVPSDLDAVVATCLRKRPDDRYPSAGALAADLERFLHGRPVSVRPPRSRRLVVVAGAAVATLLVLGGG